MYMYISIHGIHLETALAHEIILEAEIKTFYCRLNHSHPCLR